MEVESNPIMLTGEFTAMNGRFISENIYNNKYTETSRPKDA